MNFNDLKNVEYYDRVIEYLKTECKLPLRKRGGTYWMLCPFHGEKRSSFEVKHDGTQIWCRCHAGCGEHKGSYDIFDLIRKAKNIVDPFTASDGLAEYLGLEGRIDRSAWSVAAPGDKRDKNLNGAIANELPCKAPHVQSDKELRALNAASGMYHDYLLNNIDNLPEVKDYLDSRHVSMDIVRKYGIGFSPAYSSELQGRLLVDSCGCVAQDYLNAGLITILDYNGTYDLRRHVRYPKKDWRDVYGDFLAGKLILPIRDEFGNVRAIQGRKLDNKPYWADGEFKDARWWNNHSSPISSLLYGIHLNKGNIQKHKTVIIVEGIFDFWALDKHFMHGSLVVATLGSKLSEEQHGILKSLGVEHILIAYDNDIPGMKSLDKLYKALSEHVLAVMLKWGDDPDDRYGIVNKPLLDPFTISNLSASAQWPENKAKMVGFNVIGGGTLKFEAHHPKRLIERAKRLGHRTESDRGTADRRVDHFFHIGTLKSMLSYKTEKGRESIPKRLLRIRAFLRNDRIGDVTQETKKARGYVSIPDKSFRQEVFDLADRELIMYLWFLVEMQSKGRHVRITDSVIAEKLGLSERTVGTYKDELANVGLLNVKPDKNDRRKKMYSVNYTY